MTSAEAFHRAKAVIPIILCCVIIAFGIFSRPDIVWHFANSDSLQPPHMAWDMTRHGYAVANFQWSRVPSLPDLVFFFLMDWASVDWRISLLVYTCLVAVATILALGWIIARMRGSSYADGAFWSGMSVTVALLTLMGGVVLAPDELALWVPQALQFYANFHGNALVLSLVASCTALGAIRGDRRQAWLTWLICVVGMFSDTMFLANFLIPFVLAGLILAVRHRGVSIAPTFKGMAEFGIKGGVACLVGWAAKLPLFIQKMQLLSPGAATSLELFLSDLNGAPWIVFLLGLTGVLSMITLWRLRPGAEQPVPTPIAIDREWLALTGLGASVSTLGLTLAVLYAEPQSLRYALPFLWWPPAIALGLMPLPRRTVAVAATAVAGVLAVFALPLGKSVLPSWRSPLDQCLSTHRTEWGLKAGLSPYWESRQTMASSNWTLQVDQIDEEGNAYLWGSNFVAFDHDMTAPHRPPIYNFLVASEKIDQIRLEVNFGPPARYESCGEFAILIYSEPIKPNRLPRPANTLDFQFDPLRN